MLAPKLSPVQELDRAALRILRRRSAVDLALGETLVALAEGDRLLRIGYSKLTDYGRERLGLPARTLRQFTRLARGLRDRPVLRSAVAAGAVSMRKALLVLNVAIGDAEEGWVAAAASRTEKELRQRVVDGGGSPPGEAFDVESVVVRMTPEQQDRMDDGIRSARFVIGEIVPKWVAVEVIAMEYLNSIDYEDLGETKTVGASLATSLPAETGRRFEPAVASRLPTDARVLDERAVRLMEVRVGFDSEFGPVLRELRRGRGWVELGFSSWEEYVRDRLGLSPSSVRQRIWLERRMDELPALRMALRDRVLTYTKALFVAKDASPDDVEERIARAAETTLQQTERESDEREDRRNRAAGVRRLWGPRDAFETVSLAIEACQVAYRARGEPVPVGEALARMADHFVETWAASVERYRKQQPRGRQEVLGRTAGLCAVPGCTRTAVHDHHLVFRSRGGSDETWNRAGLCAAHHHRSVHRGTVRVRGRAGVRLRWEFANGERFVTRKEDEIEKVS